MQWIAASLAPLLPRNDMMCVVLGFYLVSLHSLVIARAEPVAIHCEPVRQQTNPFASPGTRWIAASLTLFSPRNDNMRVVLQPSTASLPTLSSRGRMPVAIHCVPVSEPHGPYAPIAYSGLPRLSLCSLLAMTRLICEFLIFPCLHPPCPDSTFYSYSIKQIIENSSNRRESNMPFDRLLTFII